MKTRIGLLAMLIAGSLLSVVFVSAQQPRPQQPPHPPENDPMAEALFPPELVMQHQREIGLTDEQRAFMRGEIQRVTARFNELQWQMQDAMEVLVTTMKEGVVNEQQAMAQLGKVLDTEREIKLLHMGLAIRIKNKLTPEQQENLRRMRRMSGPGPAGP